jgi:hypothetical protein
LLEINLKILLGKTGARNELQDCTYISHIDPVVFKLEVTTLPEIEWLWYLNVWYSGYQF